MLRRIERHPVVRHVVRDTTIGIVPDAVNDILFHHAPFDVGEMIHALQDTSTVSILNVMVKIIVLQNLKEI